MVVEGSVPDAGDLFQKANVEILTVRPDYSFVPTELESLILSPARKTLFFDELVCVYVLLHLPDATQQHLRQHEHSEIQNLAGRISFTMDAVLSEAAKRVDAPPLLRQDSSARANRAADQGQVISTKAVEAGTHLHVGTYRDHAVIVWAQEIMLPYARTKSTNARIAFSVAMTLNEYGAMEDGLDAGDAYMETSDPWSRDQNYNLLRALESDVFLASDPPRLSAASVSTMSPTPTALTDTAARKPKKSAKRYFPIVSAVTLQIKSFSVSTTARMILTIDLSCAESCGCSIMVETIDLAIDHATLTPIGAQSMPIHVQVGELVSWGFALETHVTASGLDQLAATLKIKSRPLTHEEHNVGPTVLSKWNTAVRVTTNHATLLPRVTTPQPVRPGPSTPTGLQRRVSAMSSANAAEKAALDGITLTVNSGSHCRVGQVMTVSITVVNKSTTGKNLGIDVARSGNVRKRKELPRLPDDPSRDMVLSNTDIARFHAALMSDPLHAICLTGHITIGFLAPEAQVEVSLQYLAMRPGLFQLHDLRVVDMTRGIFRELKDLPDLLIT